MNTFTRTLILMLNVGIVGSNYQRPAAASGGFRTVALEGTPAPGTEMGVNFHSALIPNEISSSGQTAFRGNLTGATTSTNSGIWSEGGGTGLELIARAGSQAPGADPDVFFNRFVSSPALSNSGHTAFEATLIGPGVTTANDRGVWSDGGGSGLALVARTGFHAPGTDLDVNFSDFDARHDILELNDSGHVAFEGELEGAGVDFQNDRGIWSEGGGGGLALVARQGSPAPDAGTGAVFETFESPVLNNNGHTAFVAALEGIDPEDDPGGTGPTTLNNVGIWSERGGSGLELVVREDDPAPGTGMDVVFEFFFDPALNDGGNTAFPARLRGTDVDDTNDRGIWKEDASGLTLVAREGNQAPGTDPGVHFSGTGFVALNENDQTAFNGFLTGPGVIADTNDRGVWSEGGGNGLELVARSGDQAPGLPDGVLFDEFLEPYLNDSGQTAFLAILTGTGVVVGTNERSIWVHDTMGNLQLIVRAGELFDVSDDPESPDLRTISFLTTRGSESGNHGGLNNLGQIAFNALFTDGGEGIFVADTAVIPEPSGLCLTLLAAAGLLLRTNRLP